MSAARLGAAIRGRPVGAFFVLAFAISWTLMAPAVFAGGLEGLPVAFFFLGVFGPAVAAAIVTRVTGGSIRGWLRSVMVWRVPIRWYAFALGLPFVLAVVASAEFALAGESLDFGLAAERAASLVPLFVFCLLLNGGPEELGWRGFALPRLQERLSPVRSTFLLGGLWGLWHLPLLRIEDNAGHDLATLPLIAMLAWTLGGFVAYAVTYTYLFNRTGSALLCVILHAAYNTALGVVILRPADELVGDAYVTLSLALTRGRLGADPELPSGAPARRPAAPRLAAPSAG